VISTPFLLSTPLLLLALFSIFSLSYVESNPEELIVGLWKHSRDEVLFGFFKNSGMYFKISHSQGIYEISGRYRLVDRNLLKIELDQEYGVISGEPLFTKPEILKVTIQEDRIIFHDLMINDSDEQVFNRIK
jgi:hypothetical protein